MASRRKNTATNTNLPVQVNRVVRFNNARNGRNVVGSFDAAETTTDNRRHWAAADCLSADAALNPMIRRVIVSRARYEVANNGYGGGIVNTLANHTVGTGPRLQLTGGDRKACQRIEQRFMKWSRATNFALTLKLLRIAKAVPGEGFAVIANNPGINDEHKLSLVLYETDQVAADTFTLDSFIDTYDNGQVKELDGIQFDSFGNPTLYKIHRIHPGETGAFAVDSKKTVMEVPARYVIHYANIQRPGQHRGISELATVLETMANLRRYMRAVLLAAETGANISFLMYTEAPADGEAVKIGANEIYEFEANAGVSLPAGWKASQLKPEQPTLNHIEYVHGKVNEIARPFHMPLNIALANSSGYNYASGRMDHQTYFKGIKIEQNYMECVAVDPVLNEWILEDQILYPEDYKDPFTGHQYFWDGTEHVDPLKEANAQDTRLNNGSTNHAIEYGKEGRDWEIELAQIHTENLRILEYDIEFVKQRNALLKKAGVSLEELLAATQKKASSNQLTIIEEK